MFVAKVSSNEVRQRKKAEVLSKKTTTLSSGVNARDEISSRSSRIGTDGGKLPLEAPQEKRRMQARQMRRASEGEINFFLRMETEGKHSKKWPWTEGVDTIEWEKEVTRWDPGHPCLARLGKC